LKLAPPSRRVTVKPVHVSFRTLRAWLAVNPKAARGAPLSAQVIVAAMRFARDKFFKAYRQQFGALEYSFQTEGLNALLDAMSADAKLTDVRVAAYMLATVHHECQKPFDKIWKPTWQPVEEQGKGRGRKYAKSYPVSRHDAVKAAVYYGRGYVQLTWLDNYRKAGAAVGVDLVNYPEKALEPAVAYLCLAEGLRRGWYGSKITTHINATKCDYFNARRCVNIIDKAAQIAANAEKFEHVLRTSLTQDDQPHEMMAADDAPELTTPSPAAQPGEIAPVPVTDATPQATDVAPMALSPDVAQVPAIQTDHSSSKKSARVMVGTATAAVVTYLQSNFSDAIAKLKEVRDAIGGGMLIKLLLAAAIIAAVFYYIVPTVQGRREKRKAVKS
jgi:putative chitinase